MKDSPPRLKESSHILPSLSRQHLLLSKYLICFLTLWIAGFRATLAHKQSWSQVNYEVRYLTDLVSCSLAVAVQFWCFRTAIMFLFKMWNKHKTMILCFAMQYSFTTKMVFIQMQLHNDHDYGIDYTECLVWCCMRGLDSWYNPRY